MHLSLENSGESSNLVSQNFLYYPLILTIAIDGVRRKPEDLVVAALIYKQYSGIRSLWMCGIVGMWREILRILFNI